MRIYYFVLVVWIARANPDTGLRLYRPHDYVGAFRSWSTDAQGGNRESEYHLALLYRDGEGTPRDDRKALELLKRSANRGYGPAEYQLARFLTEGRGGPADAVTARSWLRRAADQRLVSAINELGLMYMNGKGGPQDYGKAIEQFQQVARYSPAALYNIGLMNEEGSGRARNRLEACAWYTVAAERGSKMAPTKLQSVCRGFDAADTSIVRHRAGTIRWNLRLSWLGNDGVYWAFLLRQAVVFVAGIYFLVQWWCQRRNPSFRQEQEDLHQRYLSLTRTRARRWLLWYRPVGVLGWLLHLWFHLLFTYAIISFLALATLPFAASSVIFGVTVLAALLLSHTIAVWRDRHTLVVHATPGDPTR